MNITIAPELEAKIEQIAARSVDANHYVTVLLTEALLQDEQDPDAYLTEDQKIAVHAGITQGLKDFAEGRFRPFSEIAAELREQYNLSHGKPVTPN